MNRRLAFSLVAVGLLGSVAEGAVVVTSLQQNSSATVLIDLAVSHQDLNALLPPRDTYAAAKRYFYRVVDTEALQDIQSYAGPLDFMSPSPQLQLSATIQATNYQHEIDIAHNIFQLKFTLDTSHPYQHTTTSEPASAIKFTGPSGSIASNTSGTLVPGSYQLAVQQTVYADSLAQIIDPNATTTFSLSILPVPEPTSAALVVLAMIGLFGRYRFA